MNSQYYLKNLIKMAKIINVLKFSHKKHRFNLYFSGGAKSALIYIIHHSATMIGDSSDMNDMIVYFAILKFNNNSILNLLTK